ncbi:MAG: cell envelope integrity protein TolA [Gammaproteobacteria bacterium]|nr:cell envelope integrity protein TolA [Gammaproteobacteria bacterium]MDH5650899.1 cell envelope integrity protein TolA [Gammaproteobacteria bacterium]
MLEIVRQHPRAILYAAIVHLAVVGVLVVSFRWSEKPVLPVSKDKGEEIVKAVTVDAKKIDKELKKLKAAETKKQRELEAAARRVRDERLKEEKRLADAKQKRIEEQHAEEQRRVKEKERIEKEQAKLKELEEKRKKEEEQLAKLEQQKREEELKKKLAEEQQRLTRENDKHRVSKINEYTLMIKAKVQQNWNIPASAKTGMSCEIQVRLSPGGDVIQMKLTKSSGDATFDRSAENAVRKAVPLPVPSPETGLFDAFREMNLTVTKEN